MIQVVLRRFSRLDCFLGTIPFLLVIFFMPVRAGAMTLTRNTVWDGEVDVREDVLIPKGVTLTILPAARIRVQPAEGTKIDPEYLSHLTEITVRGNLVVKGTRSTPVVFSLAETQSLQQWAGIIIDHGSAMIRFCTIKDAETALLVIDGSADIASSLLVKNRYGLVGQGDKTEITLTDCRVHENEYGIFSLNDARIIQRNNVVEGNRKNDSYIGRRGNLPVAGSVYQAVEKAITRMYRDDVLLGTTIWQGRVAIEGLVRLPVDGRLIILPGTVVEFTKKDTNNDGIGENGLMIQGVLIAKGSKDKPIIFRSGEPVRGRGDWDAINILGSDRTRNLIEYCQIQDAYRGLHFHFANVSVNHCLILNNYRGIQFQESLVLIADTQLYGNKSGIRARDSEVVFTHNQVFNNLNGAQFFRLDLQAVNNIFANNGRDGLRIREGAATVVGNTITGNRFGLLIKDAEYGKFNGNFMAHNQEAGVSLRNTDHIEISGNSIQANGIQGIIIRNSRAAITGNLISENGARGIGVISFSGTISENNIVGNGLYAIGLDGDNDVAAPMNWWGASDLHPKIYDKSDEPRLGRVLYKPQRKGPVRFRWPVSRISTDISWNGSIVVPKEVMVAQGATLAVKPGTHIFFEKDAGLKVLGKIQARGEENQEIFFTSAQRKEPGDWGEIFLDHAIGSLFAHCNFEYASWVIHAHFTDLKITDCSFTNNDGGIRFRSGPMEISRSVFQNNRIGIRAFHGNAVIRGNTITGNEIGVFVRQGGGGLKLHRNNIFLNKRYGIRIGDFDNEDVDARENWWGDVRPTQAIYDGRIEDYIGKVIFEPMLAEPIGGSGYQ